MVNCALPARVTYMSYICDTYGVYLSTMLCDKSIYTAAGDCIEFSNTYMHIHTHAATNDNNSDKKRQLLIIITHVEPDEQRAAFSPGAASDPNLNAD